MVEIDRSGPRRGLRGEAEDTPRLRSPYNPSMVSASMGIYIFNTDVLIPVLLKDAEDPDSRHDFGHNILPRMVDDYKVYSFNFVDENKKEALYWRDVGTLEAYYEANMDLVSVVAGVQPVRRRVADPHAPAAVSAGEVRVRRSRAAPAMPLDSIVSMGCIVSGGVVRNSVLSPDVRVNSYARSGFQHRLLAREYRTPLPHSQGHHRSRRAHSGRHRDRLRHRSRPAEVLRHRQRHHGGDARLLAVRESGDGGLLHERVRREFVIW